MNVYTDALIELIKFELENFGYLISIDPETDPEEIISDRLYNYAWNCERVMSPLTEEEAKDFVLSNLSDVTELYLDEDPNFGKERLKDDLKAGDFLKIDKECRQAAIYEACETIAYELLEQAGREF